MGASNRIFVWVSAVALAGAVMNAPAAADPFGGTTSPNLEFVRNIRVGAFYSEGSRLVGNHLFTTDNQRGLVIYDVSDPLNPVVAGELNLAHTFENEDIPTNGSITLLTQLGTYGATVPGEEFSLLHVIDVSDRSQPHVIATLHGAGDHTYECLFDCRWAYGGLAGHILDLADPTQPKLVGNWRTQIGVSPSAITHDTTEVSPGRVLVAGDGVIYYLDTSDPVEPVLLAKSEAVPNKNLHTLGWSEGGKGDFVFSSTEAFGPMPSCAANDAVGFNFFRTWDATKWKTTGTFEVVDEYNLRNGIDDADRPLSVRGTGFTNNGCSTHWFEPHPDYTKNGLIALGAWSHGMKLLQIDAEGQIEEVGWFNPHWGDVGAAYWITDEIVYSLSNDRGLDILRLKTD